MLSRTPAAYIAAGGGPSRKGPDGAVVPLKICLTIDQDMNCREGKHEPRAHYHYDYILFKDGGFKRTVYPVLPLNNVGWRVGIMKQGTVIGSLCI